VTDLDTPTPLTDWVWGTLTMTFSSGATVSRRVNLAGAIEIRRVLADEREADAVQWWERRWFQFRSKDVVFSDFEADEDGGWRLSPEDRRTLANTDYRRGVLMALLDFWEREKRLTEVTYSDRAIAMLHHQALAGTKPAIWERMARDLTGETGAVLVKSVYEDVDAEVATDSANSEGDASSAGQPNADDLTFTETHAGASATPDTGEADPSSTPRSEGDATDGSDAGEGEPGDHQ
jgi:hypothetical protein